MRRPLTQWTTGSPRLAPAPELRRTVRGPDRSRVALQEPGPAAPPLPPRRVTAARSMDQPRQVRAPRFQFARDVLSLESQASSDPAASSVYRLVSLREFLDRDRGAFRSGGPCHPPETANLLWARIAALKEEQARQLASSARPQEPVASPRQPSGSGWPRKAGRHLGCGNRRPADRDDFEVASRRRLEGEFLRLSSCPEMVTVPGGQTLIGSRPESAGYRPEEGPAHRITMSTSRSRSRSTAFRQRTGGPASMPGYAWPILASYLSAGPGSRDEGFVVRRQDLR